MQTKIVEPRLKKPTIGSPNCYFARPKHQGNRHYLQDMHKKVPPHKLHIPQILQTSPHSQMPADHFHTHPSPLPPRHAPNRFPRQNYFYVAIATMNNFSYSNFDERDSNFSNQRISIDETALSNHALSFARLRDEFSALAAEDSKAVYDLGLTHLTQKLFVCRGEAVPLPCDFWAWLRNIWY